MSANNNNNNNNQKKNKKEIAFSSSVTVNDVSYNLIENCLLFLPNKDYQTTCNPAISNANLVYCKIYNIHLTYSNIALFRNKHRVR
jgi:hypothetical protein